jgi:N-acetylneuraminic acid mutarotase
MAISRFSNSRLTQGLPKYTRFWDQTTAILPDLPVYTQFMLAGGNAAGGSLKKNFLYNIASDTYTAKTDLTQNAGEHPGGGYYNGDAYLFGGGYDGGYAYNYAYSVSGNSWSSKTNMTEGRIDLSYATYQGYFWALGGKATGSNLTRAEVYYYNPVSNTWTNRASLPTTRGIGNTGVINNKLYLNGGYNNSGSNNATADTYEYDWTTNTWTTKASSTYNHCKNPGANASNGTYLYAMGSTEMSPNNQCERYNPSSNTWSDIADSTNTIEGNYSAYFYNGDGKIYVGSGAVQSATQVYDVPSNTWQGKTGTPNVGMTRAVIVPIP